jgi:hypothetical protein
MNMYYWDLQVVKSLNAKGIENIGVLVDDECLSEQLELFTFQIGNKRPKEYCIHGYKAKGAFHPKIMMFVGQSSMLILVGSGNMTTCGHGKNIEVWNPIYVDSKDSPLYPFAMEVWNYVSDLYGNLGKEAEWFIQSIVENCNLLDNLDQITGGIEYPVSPDYSIRFFPGSPQNNIVSQIGMWIGDDIIEEITIMSPFYDDQARLIGYFNDILTPKQIRIIAQDDFGNKPNYKKLPDNCFVYSWDKCHIEGAKKRNFHSKCIFFQGQRYSYLFCGSANASVAAMGLPSVNNVNYEASVGYKSESINFWKESGITLGEKTDKSKENTDSSVNKKEKRHLSVWLKEVSFEYDHISVSYLSEVDNPDAYINIASGNRKQSFSYKTKINEGESNVEFLLDDPFTPILSWISDANGEVISNFQFVISSTSMMQNDPSELNIKFNRNRRKIEQGDIMNAAAVKFFEEVLSESKELKQLKAVKKQQEMTVNVDNTAGNTFKSFEEYKSGNEARPTYSQNRFSESHKALSLMDSFISYINRSVQIQEDDENDDEELENANTSQGKERRGSDNKDKPNVTPESFVKYMIRLRDAVNNYMESLEDKTKLPQPSNKEIVVYDELKQFMASTFILMRLVAHCGKLGINSDTYNQVYSILPIQFIKQRRKTISEYFLRITSLFGQHVIQGKSIKALNKFEEKKLDYDKKYAFELTVAMLSVCQWINEGNQDYNIIAESQKLVSLLNIQWALDYHIDDVAETSNSVYKRLDQDIQLIDGFEKSHILSIISHTLDELNNIKISKIDSCMPGDYTFSPKFGHASVRGFIGKTSMFIPFTPSGVYHEKKEDFYMDYAIDIKTLGIMKLTTKQPILET